MELLSIFRKFPDQEPCWKHNNRRNDNCFDTFLRGVFA